jgi:hypothetical protein
MILGENSSYQGPLDYILKIKMIFHFISPSNAIDHVEKDECRNRDARVLVQKLYRQLKDWYPIIHCHHWIESVSEYTDDAFTRKELMCFHAD